MRTEQNGTSKIHVRAGTRAKLDAIAEAKHWKLVEVIEQAADALLEKEGLSIAPRSAGQGKRKPRRSAA